ncbi:acetyl-CoA carboxylase biotin carboxyl carrier protein [Caulobacter sp.]|uniref:acetyl-CoA carboxylase biotin carboxyl carrier protein n=1 Tax=Caulobacter sp. TaxID=78 RepID=UPI003BB05D1F
MSNPKAPADPVETPSIDARLVRKLADILKDTGLSEIEVEHAGLKIRVARELTVAAQATYVQAPAAAPVYASAPAAAAPAAEAAPPAPVAHAGEAVKSPMVGTVYLSPQPGADAFIKVGDTVSAGQTLLIVEAMKTMNPISAPKAGKIIEILVADAQPVEFGEPLVIVE